MSPANIICEYGMSELSSQVYQQSLMPEVSGLKSGGAFHFPPWAWARVVSPETGREVGDGETGIISIVDLANVFSVMAIQTEDLAVRRGDGFELLGRALTPDEAREVTHMARRIAALILLQPALDENYRQTKEATYVWPP